MRLAYPKESNCISVIELLIMAKKAEEYDMIETEDEMIKEEDAECAGIDYATKC